MCTADHNCFAYPGYLIDVPCESMAAKGALFTRLLAHHDEVGLSGNQIAALLDLSREYHDKQIANRIAFARLTERLELKRGRLDATALAEHKALLEAHAELFRADEDLFFTYAMRGHDVLVLFVSCDRTCSRVPTAPAIGQS